MKPTLSRRLAGSTQLHKQEFYQKGLKSSDEKEWYSIFPDPPKNVASALHPRDYLGSCGYSEVLSWLFDICKIVYTQLPTATKRKFENGIQNKI